MKRVVVVLASVLLFVIASNAQTSQAVASTDVYHVHFAKAALGQTKALENDLKKQNPKAPMPGHYLLLRHQDGDDWDYLADQCPGKRRLAYRHICCGAELGSVCKRNGTRSGGEENSRFGLCRGDVASSAWTQTGS
jgi:hypothetical protein